MPDKKQCQYCGDFITSKVHKIEWLYRGSEQHRQPLRVCEGCKLLLEEREWIGKKALKDER